MKRSLTTFAADFRELNAWEAVKKSGGEAVLSRSVSVKGWR